MSNKAKFKPLGSYGVSLGAGKHTLYEVNGAGMLFKSNFQMLASLKAGNISQFALNEGTNHFDSKETVSTVSSLLGNISASTPPIEVDRYASPTDRLLSFNILRKIRKDVTLKGNVGYSYAKSQYDYSLTRSYTDAETISLSHKHIHLCHLCIAQAFSWNTKTTQTRLISSTLCRALALS